MIETKVNYPAVGAFVLVLAAVLVAAILWLATGGAFQQRHDLYRAISEESVSGLNLNAPVKYNGVEVGKVRSIRLDPENMARVNLLFAIEHGTPIREDTVAVLKTQGLTGIAYVELSGGTDDTPLLQAAASGDYPLIRTKPSLGNRLESVLTNVLAKVDSTSNNLNVLLGAENQAALKSLLADLASVARTLADRRDSLDTGLRDAARTFKHSAKAADGLAPAIERIDKAAAAVEKMGNEVSRTSANAGETLRVVGSDVERFTAETLPELERLLGELRELTTSLRRLSEQTERNPSGLLFGRQPVLPGPGETPRERPNP